MSHLQVIAKGIRATSLLLAGALLLVSPCARAWTVFDPWNYGQNLAQAAHALQQIQNQVVSLQNEAQMLINQARNLETLPVSTMTSIRESLDRTQALLGEAHPHRHRHRARRPVLGLGRGRGHHRPPGQEDPVHRGLRVPHQQLELARQDHF
jgi:hypothetical protein